MPSVIQFRHQGRKGVVALNPNLPPGKVAFRPSHKKFSTDFDSNFCVAGVSQPYTFGNLNKQLVLLLSGLGIPDQVFRDIFRKFYDDLEEVNRDREVAVEMLQWKNKFELSRLAVGGGPLPDPVRREVAKIQTNLLESSSKRSGGGREKEKLNPMVRESRMLYGVCDQTGRLEQGQCQVRITTEGKGVLSLSGQVLVYRSPSYLLGDVRVLQAVHIPELAHLKAHPSFEKSYVINAGFFPDFQKSQG